jgi:hypothetical protein
VQFTLPQLRKLYETVMGVKLSKATFRRKVEAQGIVSVIRGKLRHPSRRSSIGCRTTSRISCPAGRKCADHSLRPWITMPWSGSASPSHGFSASTRGAWA